MSYLEIFKGNPWDVNLNTTLEPLCPPPPGPKPRVPLYPEPIPPYPIVPPDTTQYANITHEEKDRYDRAFISVDTIADRDALQDADLHNGKIVRVNDVDGAPAYYVWAAISNEWVELGDINQGIPEIIGEDAEHPIILSQIDDGLYRVKGYYKICESDIEPAYTDAAYLAFVASEEEVTQVEVITDHSIVSYTIEAETIVDTMKFATEDYVDNQLSDLYGQLPEIIDRRIELAADPIPDNFIEGLFAR